MAAYPEARLDEPSVLAHKENAPKAVFLIPVVFSSRVALPKLLLYLPLVFSFNELDPNAEL